MLSTKAIVIFRIDIKRMKNYKRVKNKDGMQEECRLIFIWLTFSFPNQTIKVHLINLVSCFLKHFKKF